MEQNGQRPAGTATLPCCLTAHSLPCFSASVRSCLFGCHAVYRAVQHAMQAGNVLRFTARFNEVSAWVVSLIVTEKKLETRAKVEP